GDHSAKVEADGACPVGVGFGGGCRGERSGGGGRRRWPVTCGVARIESVEVVGGALFDAGVHGVEVGAHSGGGVGVVEHLLNVEEVKVVGTVFVSGAVEDACGGAAEVVRAEVAES